MKLIEFMTKASHMGISPADYAELRDKYAESWQHPSGKWWSFSFNGVQVVPSKLARPGEILIMGIRDGKLVTLGKVINVEEVLSG